MDKFNQNLQLFLNNIKLVMPENSETIDIAYNFEEVSDKYLKVFYYNIYPLRNELSNRDEVIFSSKNIILENIDFNKLWNTDMTDHTTGGDDIYDALHKNIWKYLSTLYLFSYEYMNKIVLTDTLKRLKKLSKENNLVNILPDELILIDIINNLSEQSSGVIKTFQWDDNTDTDINNEGANTLIPPEMFNGMIGNLAQEIAQEIDPSKLNLDDPSKLISNLLSGNLDDENDSTGLSSLVKNISGKIQSKIDNGSLNQEAMLAEAQNLMSNLTSGNGMSDLSNLMGGAGGIPNLEGLMSGMAGLMEGEEGDEGEMPDLNNLFSGLLNKSNLNKSALKTSQDKIVMKRKLKDKLKKKKELLKHQELLLNNQPVESEYIEKDLDTLVREIEAVGKPTVNIKKKKKKKKKKKR